MLLLAGKNRKKRTTSAQIRFGIIQVLIAIGLGLGLVAGFSLTWLTTLVLGFEFASFLNVAFFLSIASIGFTLLMLATLTWTGIGGVPIYGLLMFFSLPLLQLGPEMLPTFYYNWIYPWLPMRFMFDGLREILYFNGPVWSTSTSVLIWIALISIFVLIANSWMPLKQNSNKLLD